MKEVLHVLSAIDGGGGERVVYNYYKHIDRTKVHFTITAIDRHRKQLLEDGFREMGADIVYVPKGIFARLKAINKLLRTQKFDAIHCHRIFLAELYMLLGWMNNVPIRITHAHMAFVVGHLKGRFLNWLFKPLLKLFTTHRLACGKAAGKYVWGTLKNVIILNNAVDINNFSFDSKIRSEYRKRIGVSDEDIVIGHVGRFNAQKNHPFLLHIYNALCAQYGDRNFHLVLIGEGEDEAKIRELIEKSPNKSKIHMLGLQPDVNNWMQAFDLFLLPSLFEGLPVVGIEAQAAGLPCIFSDSITSEFKMGEHVQFISLNAPVETWTKWVYDYSKCQIRDDNTKCITDKGFNINVEGKKLQNIYLS